MRPLKVTCDLATPIAGDVPMLDAMLEWCMSRHVGRGLGLSHGAGADRRPYEPGIIPIPVARRRVAGFAWPVPLATSPIYVAREGGDWHDHIARQFGAHASSLAAPGTVATTNGEFKSYRLPLRRRDVGTVAWLCVGDRKEVRRLLRDVPSIGKKVSIGCGRVAAWTVEFWDGDEDDCWFARAPAGPVLMRPLPATMPLPPSLLGARASFGGVVPPYWSAEHFAEGVFPC